MFEAESDNSEEPEHKNKNKLSECNLLGSIFQRRIKENGKLTNTSICYNFNEEINFPITSAKLAR